MTLLPFRPPLRCDGTLKILGIKLTFLQRLAFSRLERQGLKFAVNFGTSNAVKLAARRWFK